jgi:hypothetical protein
MAKGDQSQQGSSASSEERPSDDRLTVKWIESQPLSSHAQLVISVILRHFLTRQMADNRETGLLICLARLPNPGTPLEMHVSSFVTILNNAEPLKAFFSGSLLSRQALASTCSIFTSNGTRRTKIGQCARC